MADSYQIGIDMGGTFTDIVVINQRGEMWTDKADTTPENLIEGLMNCINNVSNQMEVPQTQLLNQCSRFVHGTTIVTNSIAELKGAKVGLLVTKGFKDTLRIARSPRTAERDHHKQRNMPELVDRNAILEINERIDKNGRVVVKLDEEEVLEAVRQLVEVQKVESIAVTFLWSFLNDAHEQQVKQVIESHYPSIYVTISSEVYPVMREYERMITTTLNAFTGPKVVRYVDVIKQTLEEKGLKTPVVFVQSFGGSLSSEEVRVAPITLVDSGPVGGVLGSNFLGKTLGISNMITGDMGGTSFDCSIIQNNNYTKTQRVYLREFLTGLSKIDVTAIGSGGGSIAWIDSRGIPQAGPQSASSYPGPISYGRGGELPTVTDANVILGFIDPAFFLGGRMKLDKETAESAFHDLLAAPLNMSVADAAASVYQLVIASMSNAVRSVSVERGHDPKEFTFISYGGALPVFTAEICREIGIRNAVIPATSAVFSAQGLLAGDDVRNLIKSCFWRGGQGVEHVNNVLLEMEEKITDSLVHSGFQRSNIQIQRFGDFKFEGQIFELSVPLPSGQFGEKDLEEIAKNFAPLYEAEYGPDTAWIDSEVVMLTVRVTGIGHVEKFTPKSFEIRPRMVSDLPKRQRNVYLPMERRWEDISVYNDQDITPGTTLFGPAIIERTQTTIFIPNEVSAYMDSFRNYLLEM
ncbi:hydantoinase/oxoprolinase family protein [Aneurinibacillus sp. Ricciae_BoGa-3]|uniref:hydantoinase/oxoprolinase family protein n=1 Tax=Aneurinibacillus sp. Ricciae_BoGa-3 TaxID=3022697 RepID=UPI0023420815|nr:hydantoinase/oxoprolinase family protein [Aneurinibacillus sp. Ricciae_BoGa-3]WCK56246.1 hydantoinase/oxoprolinase family protein [Aneurinibacillus sp. Ricciae_BoGa-3]